MTQPQEATLPVFSKLINAFFGPPSEREIKRYLPLLEAVREQESRYAAMSDSILRRQTSVFKERLSQGATVDDLLPEAFSACREAAKRVVGLRPFDVQILGGIVLHEGNISEMVTGEGKTLVATLPAYLNALTGEGVHIVTVNDYLARRDAEWMGSIFEFMGLTVGLIQQHMPMPERQVGYRADITYGTNNEFGFDYLRDNMAIRPEHRVQRGHAFAIVDEVDSILIDEARTPLIISGRPEKSSDIYLKIDDAVRKLRRDEHYTIDEKQRHVLLTDEGMEAAERALGVDNLYTSENIALVHMIEQAIKAHNFFKKDVEYMVRDGEVLIVDEFTGRIMEGRRYSDGLHQALEAKERVPLKFESQTVATITYQNYFRLYKKLCGMTGTASTEAAEFQKIYNLEVVQIPTNLPLVRQDETDLVFATAQGKFKYVVREIKDIREQGRPVLVGTVSIEKSELVAQLLEEIGIDDYQVLNAKHHEREAAIIGAAGKPGAITIATNMAGRGTDIKLAEGVREAGGLFIIGTERHESRRIDNQLRGRAGRQGDPGSTRFYVSLEDDVARLFGGERVKRMLNMMGSDQLDDEPLSQRMVSRSIERAQRQVEEYNFEIRKHVLDYDEVMDKQRRYIYGMRREVLEDRDITTRFEQMIEDAILDRIDEFADQEKLPEDWDLDGLEASLETLFGFEFDSEGETDPPEPLPDLLKRQALEEYRRREQTLAEALEESYSKEVGKDNPDIDFGALARRRTHDLELMVLLRSVDDRWIDHLYDMDYLRESVRLRAFGQRDPLLEYKHEAFALFKELVKAIEENVIQTLYRLTDPEVQKKRETSIRQGTLTEKEDPFAGLQQYTYVAADKQADRSFTAFDTGRFALGGQTAANAGPGAQGQTNGGKKEAPRKAVPVRTGPKVKPNEPCPCGSGKKYKKCCGNQAG